MNYFTEVFADTVVVKEGTLWPYFCIVIAGEIEIITKNQKRRKARLTPGNWFGNLKHDLAPATLTASKDCLLVSFIQISK